MMAGSVDGDIDGWGVQHGRPGRRNAATRLRTRQPPHERRRHWWCARRRCLRQAIRRRGASDNHNAYDHSDCHRCTLHGLQSKHLQRRPDTVHPHCQRYLGPWRVFAGRYRVAGTGGPPARHSLASRGCKRNALGHSGDLSRSKNPLPEQLPRRKTKEKAHGGQVRDLLRQGRQVPVQAQGWQDGETIAAGEGCKTKASALNGIESVKKNAP
jgi:hypothetical protein